MTRQDWIDDITTWYELIDFCNDEGYEDYINDIYSEESRDDYISNDLVDMARNADSWVSLMETLQDIPTGYDYYRQDDYGEWFGLDDDYDFRDRKEEILDRLDEDEFWDDYDEEEEPIEEYEDPEDSVPVEDEDMDVSELFTTCASTLQKLDSAESDDGADPLDEFCSKLAVSVEVQVEIKEGSNS